MINIERNDNIDTITFNVNRIDALITEELRESISRSFTNSNSKVIIDLKGVDYIDSSGFGCFLSLMKTARNNYGILRFANPEPHVRETFYVLHLQTVFQIYEDYESCLKSFR